MDASLDFARLSEDLESLLAASDFEGAENLLVEVNGSVPHLQGFIHFQYGRLYARWNKLTSAIGHLEQAAALAHERGDQIFLIQVSQELKMVKDRQARQSP